VEGNKREKTGEKGVEEIRGIKERREGWEEREREILALVSSVALLDICDKVVLNFLQILTLQTQN
jgi:hypothetical protein